MLLAGLMDDIWGLIECDSTVIFYLLAAFNTINRAIFLDCLRDLGKGKVLL